MIDVDFLLKLGNFAKKDLICEELTKSRIVSSLITSMWTFKGKSCKN